MSIPRPDYRPNALQPTNAVALKLADLRLTPRNQADHGFAIIFGKEIVAAEDMGARFGVPSSLTVLISTTGVPKYRMAG